MLQSAPDEQATTPPPVTSATKPQLSTKMQQAQTQPSVNNAQIAAKEVSEQLSQTMNGVMTPTADNSAPVGNAWVIQLGSFTDANHAKTLVAQLQAKGFTAYTRTFKTAKGVTMTRVLAGPETQRAKAQALQTKLASDLHLQGVIVAYNPIQVK